MADIMMCDERECPNVTFCKRSPDSGTRPDPMYQSWWMRPENMPVGDYCLHFWPTNPRRTGDDIGE